MKIQRDITAWGKTFRVELETPRGETSARIFARAMSVAKYGKVEDSEDSIALRRMADQKRFLLAASECEWTIPEIPDFNKEKFISEYEDHAVELGRGLETELTFEGVRWMFELMQRTTQKAQEAVKLNDKDSAGDPTQPPTSEAT
jgi:hypothetical protein